MILSLSPHSTTTGSSRSLSCSSSAVRSALRARLATFHMARGLRMTLGSASSSTTGSTWRIENGTRRRRGSGCPSPTAGVPAIDAAQRVDQHEVAHPLGVVVGQLDRRRRRRSCGPTTKTGSRTPTASRKAATQRGVAVEGQRLARAGRRCRRSQGAQGRRPGTRAGRGASAPACRRAGRDPSRGGTGRADPRRRRRTGRGGRRRPSGSRPGGQWVATTALAIASTNVTLARRYKHASDVSRDGGSRPACARSR